MLLAGDKLGHMQLGNKQCIIARLAAYLAQLGPARDQRELLEFVRGLIQLRIQNPCFDVATYEDRFV